jgi:hypothetical protein
MSDIPSSPSSHIMRLLLLLALVGACAVGATKRPDAQLEKLGDVKFSGEIHGNLDISAVGQVGQNLLVIGSDEGGLVQILKKSPEGYAHLDNVVFDQKDREIDIEGIAVDGRTVYVTGSHNRVRDIGKKGGGGVGAVKRKESREEFFRFTVNEEGKASEFERKSLMGALKNHPVLSGFIEVASKENGIDIEGLAVKNGRLFFGFRSPILRDNWVPILSCEFDKPKETAKVAYIHMGGRGIRDITAIDEGFLIIGGPPGDGDQNYRLYFWDGQDALVDGEQHNAKELAVLPSFGKGKPEGLTVLKRDGKVIELLIVCDGLLNGSATRWKLTLP